MQRPVIDFEQPVSVPFFVAVMKAVSKHHGKVTVSIEDMELLRRACSVIEAIATDEFAETTPRPAPTNHESAW